MTSSVVYWNNLPAPYMVDRFNAFATRSECRFEAWFSARTNRDRSWVVEEKSWAFRYRFLPSVGQGEYPLALPTPLFAGQVPDLLVTLYAAPSFVVGSTVARLRGARVALWVEVTFDAWVKRRRWKEALKSGLFRRADAILTAGADGRDFAVRSGAPPDRIMVLPHVVDFQRFADRSALDRRERAHLRMMLGLRGVTFVYVGRLWLGKGINYLIDAFAELQRASSQHVSLLLVGDGADEQLLRAQCAENRLENVVFAGFHDADSLARIYAAADVFVFPTLGDPFGMVVLEAMACGLPVVATSASGEIRDRISDGENGFIVPPADSQVLSERMGILASDAKLRQRMGEASRAKVAGHSPDAWAETFEAAVHRILALPRASDRR